MSVPDSQPFNVQRFGDRNPLFPIAVGILGGTFDPIHRGHLAIATAAVQQAQLDQLLWIPDPHPPHKAKSAITPLEHRINMIQAAIASFPNQQVWQIVQDEGSAPSFAIATLNTLQQTQPNCRWYWILGLDAFCSLPRWYRSEELVDQCQWIVAPRSDAVGETAINKTVIDLCEQVVAYFASCDRAIQYQLLDLTTFQPIPAASSLIRQRYQTQLPQNQIHQIDQWLPTSVQHYIQQHQLYSCSQLY